MRSRGRSRQKQRERTGRRKQVKREAWGRPLHIDGLEWRYEIGRYEALILPPEELRSGPAAHSGLRGGGLHTIAGSALKERHSGLPPTRSVIAGSPSGEAHSGLMGETPIVVSSKGRIRVLLTQVTGLEWDELAAAEKEGKRLRIPPAIIKTWVELAILGKRDDTLYALCELMAGGHRGRLIDLYSKARQDVS